MTETNPSKLSSDLMISRRFKYTPIFKNSFYNKKEKPREPTCRCCHSKVTRILGNIVLGLLLLLTMAATGFIWSTDLFQNSMIQELVLRNNSQALDWWQNPPVKPTLKVYIFNYSNTEEFLARRGKLRVEQLGPYYYKETFQKVNVIRHSNGSLSYQEKHSFQFFPEKSVGTEKDRLLVPNMPLMSAVSHTKDQNIWLRLGLSTLLSTLKAEPFVKVSVGELIWGYDDPLFTMGRTVLALKEEVPFKRFGLFMMRNGTTRHSYTINSGVYDTSKLGIISHYNGKDRLDFWGSEECNRIDGSEGSVFPLHMVRPNSTLHVYNRDICRRFPLVFKEHSEAFKGIPTLRFHQPRDVFSSPDKNPSNACFCHPDSEVCPPSGVFNASPCAFNTPIMMSFPHFYLGEESLLEPIEGLKPDPELHDSYVDMHPKLGVPLAGWSRMQVNIMVRRANGIQQIAAFKDRTILPVAWFEIGMEELPEEIKMMFFHATFSTRAIQLGCMYGLPPIAILLACLLYGRTCRRETATDNTKVEVTLP